MRSTGPKTAAGKALSRMNANKHGLTAETIVIGDEDPNGFYSFREELGRNGSPRPGMESALVDRLAEQIWRLRRAPVFEAALIQVRRASLAAEKNYHGEPVYEPEEYMGYALINDARYGDTLGKLSRYEAGLMNGLCQNTAVAARAAKPPDSRKRTSPVS